MGIKTNRITVGWKPRNKQKAVVARQQTKSKEREESNNKKKLMETRSQTVGRERRCRGSCQLQQQHICPILKKWTSGTVRPSLSPSHLFLSHAWLDALFSQVQRCVTSTQMSLKQVGANEPGIPWEGSIIGIGWLWIMGVGWLCLWGWWGGGTQRRICCDNTLDTAAFVIAR